MISKINSTQTFQAVRNTTVSKNSRTDRANGADQFSASNMMRKISAISMLDSVAGMPVVDLRAENNVLTFNEGVFYRINTAPNMNYIFSNSMSMWEQIRQELGWSVDDLVDNRIFETFHNIGQFIGRILTGTNARVNLDNIPKQERLAFFEALNIQTEEWVTINNNGQSRKRFVTNDGEMWSWGYVERARLAMNNRNDWRESGFMEGSVIRVNGNEYVVDENGRIYIPQGEAVIPGRIDFSDQHPEYKNWLIHGKREWNEETQNFRRLETFTQHLSRISGEN